MIARKAYCGRPRWSVLAPSASRPAPSAMIACAARAGSRLNDVPSAAARTGPRRRRKKSTAKAPTDSCVSTSMKTSGMWLCDERTW